MKNLKSTEHFYSLMSPKKQLRPIFKKLQEEYWSLDACETIEKKIVDLDAFKKAKTVLGYCEVEKEVQVTPLVYSILNGGYEKRIALPVINNLELELYLVKHGIDLKPVKKYNKIFIEPDPSMCQRIDINDIDFCIVPGLAFDEHCYRLGRGKGHYDRLLQNYHGFKLGVCLDVQIAKVLPREEHDVRMDCVLSEKREIRLV